jgi:hypothetical protein
MRNNHLKNYNYVVSDGLKPREQEYQEQIEAIIGHALDELDKRGLINDDGTIVIGNDGLFAISARVVGNMKILRICAIASDDQVFFICTEKEAELFGYEPRPDRNNPLAIGIDKLVRSAKNN